MLNEHRHFTNISLGNCHRLRYERPNKTTFFAIGISLALIHKKPKILNTPVYEYIQLKLRIIEC